MDLPDRPYARAMLDPQSNGEEFDLAYMSYETWKEY